MMGGAHLPRRCASGINLGPMRVFEIDCGTEITGFGVMEAMDSGHEHRLMLVGMGRFGWRRRRQSGWSRCVAR